MQRGILGNIVCVHYGYHSQDDRHILFDCPFVKQVCENLRLCEKLSKIAALTFQDLAHTVLWQFENKDVAVFAKRC